MSFILPEIVIESVIRDGLANLRRKPAIIDNIFSTLTEPYASEKYGQKELNKIKTLILKKQINVVHNLSDVSSQVPAFSIQLGLDVEAQNHALLEDFSQDEEVEIVDEEELNALKVVPQVIPISYNEKSGRVIVSPATDLSNVHPNLLWIDAAGQEFEIRTVIKNGAQPGFFIEKNANPDLSDFGEIKSSLNFHRYEEKTIISDEQVVVGVHSKDALTTKYLYILLKFFMVSRKPDLIRRNFKVSSFQGSDFLRTQEYTGDHVYSRYYTVTGKIEDSWRSSEVELIDQVIVEVTVPKDEASAADLGLETSTVKPSEN